MRSLFWFRSDLRMRDNEALAQAMRGADSLIAVFLLTPTTWLRHDIAPSKIRFCLDNLRVLSDALAQRGIPLIIRNCKTFSGCADTLHQLCKQHNIDSLYYNREYPLDEIKRDEAVQEKLSTSVTLHCFDGNLVLKPGDILNKQAMPYKIFTPFKKAWLMRAQQTHAWHTTPMSRQRFNAEIAPDKIPRTLVEFSGQQSITLPTAGEQAAKTKCLQFCRQHLVNYHEQRDCPNIDGTSRLSAYLSLGVISPRQCISAALQSCGVDAIDHTQSFPGANIWINELIWREFYQHIVYLYPDVCRHRPFQAKTETISWSTNTRHLAAWKQGQTGFPIVDAAMRQLEQTGWMHNRLRMISAMFLSKILLLDWRLGEQHFMQHLIDGEFAANNGGWQWCASTGTDAAPYFRIFNPTTQSQRFDANGDFIRRFCPELSNCSAKVIHNPYAFGVKPGTLDYPEPIVDYKHMRTTAIDVYKQALR